MSRIVPTMKDDIVVDRSPIVEQYLPPKPKPIFSNPSSSGSPSPQGGNLNKKQMLLQNNIALHKKYESMVLDWTLILCDPVNEDTLGEAANRIKQSHYQEIIDERNIGNLCGYPLCDQPPRHLKGKFRISLGERKVFDISELKKYCSSNCLSASRWFESQLTEEPLYLVDTESAYIKTTRISIMPLGVDITEFHAQRRKDASEKEAKPAPAFSLPEHSLDVVSPDLSQSKSKLASTSSSASERKLSYSLENEYVQTLLASVPETPSFIKIVERDTMNTTLLDTQDMGSVDREMRDAFGSDDDDKEDENQHDSVEGFRIPANPKPQKLPGSIGMLGGDTKMLEKKMSQVTLSDNQRFQSQDHTMSRTASSTSMDTQP
ncbi:RNA polymerase II associated protein 2 [Mortierella sp. AM989]|nr:RNA polymerase II associated protein 2 [Mortierella sp. AM989]